MKNLNKIRPLIRDEITKLIYSKDKTNSFPEEGEIINLLGEE